MIKKKPRGRGYDVVGTKKKLQQILRHLQDTDYTEAGDLKHIAEVLGITLQHKLDPDTTRDIGGTMTDGRCPACGGELQAEASSICAVVAIMDTTAFPTIEIEFSCRECNHTIEVEYDAVDVILCLD